MVPALTGVEHQRHSRRIADTAVVRDPAIIGVSQRPTIGRKHQQPVCTRLARRFHARFMIDAGDDQTALRHMLARRLHHTPLLGTRQHEILAGDDLTVANAGSSG
jgi:hypothetical protein